MKSLGYSFLTQRVTVGLYGISVGIKKVSFPQDIFFDSHRDAIGTLQCQKTGTLQSAGGRGAGFILGSSLFASWQKIKTKFVTITIQPENKNETKK